MTFIEASPELRTTHDTILCLHDLKADKWK